jgi:hypothetical protein
MELQEDPQSQFNVLISFPRQNLLGLRVSCELPEYASYQPLLGTNQAPRPVITAEDMIGVAMYELVS